MFCLFYIHCFVLLNSHLLIKYKKLYLTVEFKKKTTLHLLIKGFFINAYLKLKSFLISLKTTKFICK